MKRYITLAVSVLVLAIVLALCLCASASAPKCADDAHQWTWRTENHIVYFDCALCDAHYSANLGSNELPACKGGEHHIFYSTIMGSNCEKREIEFECTYENCRECIIFTLPKSEQNVHRYAEESRTEPTCIAPGYIVYRCQNPGCRHGYSEQYATKLGHDVSQPTYSLLYKKADCIHNAIYYRTCARCNIKYKTNTYQYDEKPNSALGHTDLQKQTTEKARRTARTATSPATYYYTCGKCGNPVTDGGYFYGEFDRIPMSEFMLGDIVQLGSYPQSMVKDEQLLEIFESMPLEMMCYDYKQFNSNEQPADIRYGDFEYMGNRYRKVVIAQDRPANLLLERGTFSGQSKVGTYYFRWEPLNWKVYSTPVGFKKLICCNIIDFQSFFTSKDFADFFDINPWFEEDYAADYENGIFNGNLKALMNDFISDYSASYLKKWLEKDFKQQAFTQEQANALYSCAVNDSINKIDVPTRVTQINEKTKRILTERHTYGVVSLPIENQVINVELNYPSYRARVSDYALTLRPDYTDNPVNKTNGIYYADGIAYAESAFTGDLLGNTCLAQESGKEGIYYQKTDTALLFAPYYGARPVINLKDDYVPEFYSIQGLSTIENVKTSSYRLYDVNGDNVIDIADVSGILSNLGRDVSTGVNDQYDVNSDMSINITDICQVLTENTFGVKVD
ncbi:MAG: hypothetical protein IJG23_01550 [Clostridia bacterium]|nr:hypothetical protein [Clostridia bacterium]